MLGKRLVGLYLGGSYVMGDFVEASSDYDVLVIVAERLTEHELGQLEDLHQRLCEAFPDAVRLEGDYVPRELLLATGTTEPVPLFLNGILRTDVQEIMLSADNVANMRENSIAVFGPPARTVLPEPSREDVRRAAREMIQEGPEHCPTEQQAATEVLNLVRAMRSMDTGRPATKADGVEWALQHLEANWQALVRRADQVRRGAPTQPADHELRQALPAFYQAVRASIPNNPTERLQR